MTFVALSIADWPTGAAANDLLARLLSVAPRAAVSPAEHLAWLDARGLEPTALTQRAIQTLAEIGITTAGAGASSVPIVAAIAAREKREGKREKVGEKGEERTETLLSFCFSPPFSLFPSLFSPVVAGTERSFLAPLPLEVLSPPAQLLSLFVGVGLECCGDLGRLSRESVEVRFGRDGLALWRLARAEDRRPIFSSRPRELPNASLDWSEFSTTDLEQLVFVLHSLLRTVCDALLTNGMGARSLTLTLGLENRATIVTPVGAARSTAQRTTWLRLMRRALERITLPDRVSGIAVQVDAVGAPEVRQGDLFDLGFASAHAAERAVAQVMELQSDAVVRGEGTGEGRPERRVRWVVAEESSGETRASGLAQSPERRSKPGARGREAAGSPERPGARSPEPVQSSERHGEPRVEGISGLPAHGGLRALGSGLAHSLSPHGKLPAPGSGLAPSLQLLLLPLPRELTVLTRTRRGFPVPFRYTDNGTVVSLQECLGPQCLSGGEWSESFAREYHQAVRTDGVAVLIYRDVPTDRWYLAGWWD